MIYTECVKPVLLIAIASATVFGTTQETQSQREARFEKVERSLGSTYDGTWKAAAKICPGRMNDEQAFVLAKAFFYAYVSGCGAVKLPGDGGKTWNFETLVGFTARPGLRIFVDKATGKTWTDSKVQVFNGKRLVDRIPKPVENPRIYLAFTSNGAKK
jgi:hypothetical protein